MKHLFEDLGNVLARGEEAVLVTVIASSGSTPRGAGSRMLVRGDGSIRGTIGGGAVEYRAIQLAMDAMREKVSYTKGFNLTKNEVSDIGMVCGGRVTVYFQYVSPKDEEFRELCLRIQDAFGRDEDSWLVMDISDETCWRMGIGNRREGWENLPGKPGIFGSRAGQWQAGGRSYYVEPLVQAGRVCIFGGGHVARELVPVLAHLGFRCVVMDDREEFASPRVFPEAEQIVVGDMERIGDYLAVGQRDYVCVMTRGHSFDYLVQRQMLVCRPRYLGVIGSRNKIAAVAEKLLQDGFTREEIEMCHMPVGTQIYAETPAEIAIIIAGELIAVRAGHPDIGRHMDL